MQIGDVGMGIMLEFVGNMQDDASGLILARSQCANLVQGGSLIVTVERAA